MRMDQIFYISLFPRGKRAVRNSSGGCSNWFTIFETNLLHRGYNYKEEEKHSRLSINKWDISNFTQKIPLSLLNNERTIMPMKGRKLLTHKE